jgi:hypothetical protein
MASAFSTIAHFDYLVKIMQTYKQNRGVGGALLKPAQKPPDRLTA